MYNGLYNREGPRLGGSRLIIQKNRYIPVPIFVKHGAPASRQRLDLSRKLRQSAGYQPLIGTEGWYMIVCMPRPWKHPATSVYWLRKVVPFKLREKLGKRELKWSLQTKDRAEALAKYPRRWSERSGCLPPPRTVSALSRSRRPAWRAAGLSNALRKAIVTLRNSSTRAMSMKPRMALRQFGRAGQRRNSRICKRTTSAGEPSAG